MNFHVFNVFTIFQLLNTNYKVNAVNALECITLVLFVDLPVPAIIAGGLKVCKWSGRIVRLSMFVKQK